MKALSLLQPWATLIAIGAKQIETRSWCTPYRGPLAIHASKAFHRDDQELCEFEPFASVLASAGLKPADLPRGAVIATCRLVACRQIPTQLPATFSKQEEAFGNYAPGRWGWVLRDVQPLPEPVPATGSLGLWEWRP